MTEYRAWPRDPRFLVGDDGTIIGLRGRPLSAYPRKGDGYLALAMGRKWPSIVVHLVICETFHGPCPEGMQAAHRNGNKLDCRAENLRWTTPLANSMDRIQHGTQAHGEGHGNARLTESAVREIRSSSLSAIALAARHGVAVRTIYSVLQWRTWRHVR